VSRMFEELGVKGVSVQEMRDNWVQPYMLFWQKYCPGITLEQEQKLYYSVITRKDCPKAQLCDGIVDLLRKLKDKNVAMVILSSDPNSTLRAELKTFGLENVFDDIMLNIHDKSEEIHKLIERNKFKKEETVFIGDSNHEVEVGRDAGIKTIAVTWGFSTDEKLRATNPDYLVHNVKELEEVLLK
jgi:phosphoglycolate phosphatase